MTPDRPFWLVQSTVLAPATASPARMWDEVYDLGRCAHSRSRYDYFQWRIRLAGVRLPRRLSAWLAREVRSIPWRRVEGWADVWATRGRPRAGAVRCTRTGRCAVGENMARRNLGRPGFMSFPPAALICLVRCVTLPLPCD